MGYYTYFNGKFTLGTEAPQDVVDHVNQIENGQFETTGSPDSHSGWFMPDASTLMMRDGGKYYDYTDWLRWLVDIIFKPFELTMVGEIEWDGEEPGDIGKIRIDGYDVTVLQGRVTYTEVGEGMRPTEVTTSEPSANPTPWTDAEALNEIALLLGTTDEWDADTLDEIARFVAHARPYPGSIGSDEYGEAMRACRENHDSGLPCPYHSLRVLYYVTVERVWDDTSIRESMDPFIPTPGELAAAKIEQNRCQVLPHAQMLLDADKRPARVTAWIEYYAPKLPDELVEKYHLVFAGWNF